MLCYILNMNGTINFLLFITMNLFIMCRCIFSSSMSVLYLMSKGDKNKLPLHQNVTQLIAELEQFQAKHTSMIKDQHEAQRTFETESNSHTQLKQDIEQQKTSNDDLQRQIVSLQTERNQLQANKSSIGKTI